MHEFDWVGFGVLRQWFLFIFLFLVVEKSGGRESLRALTLIDVKHRSTDTKYRFREVLFGSFFVPITVIHLW